MDKKAIAENSSQQQKNHQYSTDKASSIKKRRRDMHKELSTDKREAFLLQRRTRYLESTNQILQSNSATSTNNEELPLTNVQLRLTGQRGVSITEMVPHSETGNTSRTNTSKVLLAEEKNILGCPCIFEIGSTSAAIADQHNPDATTTTTRGLTLLPQECHDPRATHAKNKGSRLRGIHCFNIKELPSSASILKKVPQCKYCTVKRFEYESAGFCCSNGTIKLTSHEMPKELLNLYLGDTDESRHFRTYIRMYNNMFAFTSLGVKYDKELATRYHGIYTFRVQGQMYHFIDDLIPSNQQPKNLQLYIYDDDTEMLNRMAACSIADQLLLQKLMNILKINPYYIFLKSLMQVPKLPNLYIALKCDSKLNQQVYNLPTVSEVAAIWLDQNLINNC